MKKFKDVKEGDSLYVVLKDDWSGVTLVECKLTKGNFEIDFFDEELYVYASELKPYTHPMTGFSVHLEDYSANYLYNDGRYEFDLRIFTDETDAKCFYRDYKEKLIQRHKDALKKIEA